MHADRPLWVRYNLDAVGRWFEKEKLRDREPTMWRYRELLPLPNGVRPVSLGEGMTPVLDAPRLAKCSGCGMFGSRTNRNCRPAASRAAAWPWPSRWRSNSA